MLREGGIVEHNLLEQFDQLVGQIGGHECLDSGGDVLGVLRLGKCGLHHLKTTKLLLTPTGSSR